MGMGITVKGSKWTAGKKRKCYCVYSARGAEKRCFRSKNLAQKFRNSLGTGFRVEKRKCLRDRFKKS